MCTQMCVCMSVCLPMCLKALIISIIPLHVRKITYITGAVVLKTQATYSQYLLKYQYSI